jgi:hypothetical protein
MSMKKLNHHELLVMFSATHNCAIVSIHYPSTDSRRQFLQDACTHSLRQEGHPEAAEAIANGAPFMAFDDVHEAQRVAHCVRAHSAEISANLFWKGKQNDEIADALRQEQDEAEHRERLHHHDPKAFARRAGTHS